MFVYHDAFNQNKTEVDDLKDRYTKGKVGDVEVKKKLISALETFLEPIRDRRESFRRQEGLVLDILQAGSDRMREESEETLELVRDAMGLQHYLRRNPSECPPD